MSSNCNLPDFSNLPEDIIYKIFDFLNFADQLAAGSTCKLWRYILFSKTIQKSKELRLSRVILEDCLPPCMFLLMGRQPFVNVHLYETTFKQSSRMANYIGEMAHSLILDTVNIDNEQFDKLLKHLNNLESLTIKHCPYLLMTGIKAATMQQLNTVMSNVCHLALPENQYLSDYMFYNLTLSIKILKSLDLSYCPIAFHNALQLRFYPNVELEASDNILTFKYVSQVILQHKLHLKYLNLSSTMVSDAALEVLASADDGGSLQLEELHLASCNQFSLKALHTFLQTQSSLVVLSLGGSKCVNDNLLKTLVEHLPRIEKLILENCKSITNNGIAFIVQLKNLKYLNISICKGISGKGIKCHLNQLNDRLQILKVCYLNLCEDNVMAIARYYRQLRVLDLSHCSSGVTDISVQFIIKHLRWLRSLSLENCSTLTDYAFTSCSMSLGYADFIADVSAAINCYNNDSLNVDKNRKEKGAENKNISLDTFEASLINNSDLETVTLQNLKGLQTLNLNYCTNITDITMKFGIRLKELRQLYLSNCHQITKEGFKSLVYTCPSLEEINLCECYQVTDDVIDLITNKLHRLRRLHINGCLQLTTLSVHHILQNCKILKVLSIQRCPQLNEKRKMLSALPTLRQINSDY